MPRLSCPPLLLYSVVDCGILGDIKDGHVVYDSDPPTTFGSTVSYTCDIGYTLTAPVMQTCEANGQWSGSAATCDGVCCIQLREGVSVCKQMYPRILLRARHSLLYTSMTDGLGVFLHGSECVYRVIMEKFCIYAHTADDCGGLSNPANGSVNTDGGTTFKCRAVYSCDAGYTLNGTQVRRCAAGGNWTNSEPTCNSEPLIHLCYANTEQATTQ